MKTISTWLAAVATMLLISGCAAPGGEGSADNQEPVTITSTITSGETPTESAPQKDAKEHKSKKQESKLAEVDPGKFYAVDYYGNEVWSVTFRDGDVSCQFRKPEGKDGMLCMVSNWKEAPRNLDANKDFFGAPLNAVVGGVDPFEAGHVLTILPDGGKPMETRMNPGEKTTINGFEISVDENNAVNVRHGENFFTFDGALTTQSWSQHPDANGWSAPGAFCGQTTEKFGERVYFVGRQGGKCDVGLEAVRQYRAELENGGGEGVSAFWDNGEWQCFGDETYAPGTAGADRMRHCELGEAGDMWGANPAKYPDRG